MATILGNLGVHVMQFPSGRWGFVGSLPAMLGDEARASAADVMAGRAYTREGAAYRVNFPVFDTRWQAEKHAETRGVTLANKED